MECVDYRIKANGYDLVSHDGPYFDHWRQRCLASFGVFVLDERSDAA